MNYVEKVRKRLDKIADVGDPALLDLYTLLVFTTGVDTNWENVHDAWSLWRNRTNPEHESLIPFDKLTPEIKMLDREYADAIVEVAYEIGNIS